MYNDSFWDTAYGHRLAAVLIEELPKITNRRQYLCRIHNENLNEQLSSRLEDGERLISMYADPTEPGMTCLVMEKTD